MTVTGLSGRNALVTGGAVRIGRAIALHLARAGVNVCIHYGRSEQAAAETLSELRACNVLAGSVSADFSGDVATVAQAVFSAARGQVGPIDLLVNSAAIFEADSLDNLDPEQWDRQLRINLQTPLWLSREFARQLPTGTAGDIINIVDWRAERPRPGHLSYTVAKAGLVAATRLLALELAPAIRVNAIAPGAILPAPGTDASEFEQQAARIPLQQTGSPADIAIAIEYLTTARFVTGEVLYVTGGEAL